MKNGRWNGALLVALLWSSGCSSGTYLSDDLGGLDIEDHILEWLSGPTADSDKTIHQPYALGTKVRIAANTSNPFMDESDLAVEVADTSVLRVDSVEGNYVNCTAIAEGEAAVHVVDGDGDRINTVTISVVSPSRLELFFAGAILIGRPGAEARVEDARIVVGGMGTFLVRYLDGDTLLYGSHIVQDIDDDDVRVTRQVMGTRGERDLIHVEPLTGGTHELELSSAGGPLATFPVTGVSADSMHRFMLLRESTDDTDDGAQRSVLARGYDEGGLPIYGLSWSWTDESYVHDEVGDLYIYEYAEDGDRTLTASLNGQEQEITLQSTEAGMVTSTNDMGCSGAGRPNSSGAALTLLVLGAFVFTGRLRSPR